MQLVAVAYRIYLLWQLLGCIVGRIWQQACQHLLPAYLPPPPPPMNLPPGAWPARRATALPLVPALCALPSRKRRRKVAMWTSHRTEGQPCTGARAEAAARAYGGITLITADASCHCHRARALAAMLTHPPRKSRTSLLPLHPLPKPPSACHLGLGVANPAHRDRDARRSVTGGTGRRRTMSSASEAGEPRTRHSAGGGSDDGGKGKGEVRRPGCRNGLTEVAARYDGMTCYLQWGHGPLPPVLAWPATSREARLGLGWGSTKHHSPPTMRCACNAHAVPSVPAGPHGA